MNKTAIVTGATGNLGQAVVNHFLDKGLKVIATFSPHEHPPTQAFENNPQLVKYELNVTNEEASQQFAAQIIREHETIDVVALLVGGFAMGNIGTTDGNAIKKMFALNFESAYYLAREVFNQMIKQPLGGHIFLVGARPALIPEAGKDMMAYALTKSLIFRLAELLNAEGRKKNVVTSVIVPSILDTPQNRASMPDANFSNWVKPEEVAEIMYFTLSESAKSLREPIIKVYGNA